MNIITNYRGTFELMQFTGTVLIGAYYYVNYNTISHHAAPYKEFEIVKILKYEDHSNFYITDRGTRIKTECILNCAIKIEYIESTNNKILR